MHRRKKRLRIKAPKITNLAAYKYPRKITPDKIKQTRKDYSRLLYWEFRLLQKTREAELNFSETRGRRIFKG